MVTIVSEEYSAFIFMDVEHRCEILFALLKYEMPT
jgi:hypothetical protein